jgi:DNA (cytosine-5)-methyltransferase 1
MTTHASAKPPYVVPTMAEIAAVPKNGFRVASLFSGCGGSSLGYRMAGFDVVYANEFIPAAQDTYRANFPGTWLDTRDIRSIQPAEILAAIGIAAGDLDVLDGSPPCASFSTAGKREEGWGRVKLYSDTHQRTDDLFFEYARILRGVQPRVFVAENVAGLVRGTAKGYFKLILAELKSCGYRVEARLLDAQWLGVPQMRERLIFIGVRSDLGLAPVFPRPLPYRYSVRDACPWIDAGCCAVTATNERHTLAGRRPARRLEAPAPTIKASVPEFSLIASGALGISRYAIGKQWDQIRPGQTHEKRFNLSKPALDGPCPTITATGGNLGAAAVVHPLEKRKFTITELKRLSAFPDDFVLTGPYTKQWERIGRAVPPVMMFHIASAVRDGILCKLQ